VVYKPRYMYIPRDDAAEYLRPGQLVVSQGLSDD